MGKRLSMLEGLTPRQEAFLKQGKPAGKKENKQTSQHVDLVTFTVRLPRDMANALRKVAVERKVAGMSPATQQEVVQEALERWLKEHG
jgi:hypothetical protein